MIILTVDEVIKIHGRLIEKTGGLDGLRDRGLLESAIFSISSGFGEIEVYLTVEEKAARIALGLGVADGSIGYDEILDWIISHKIME